MKRVSLVLLLLLVLSACNSGSDIAPTEGISTDSPLPPTLNFTPLPTEEPTSVPTETEVPTETPTLPPTETASPTPVLEIGSTMPNPKDGMTLVYVPAGEFEMGSKFGGGDENFTHMVYVDAYWMNQTEVTNDMFIAFLNERGNQSEGGGTWLATYEGASIIESGGLWTVVDGFGDHPVVDVSWYGARAYCEWAGGRLPTEAEWEKAARGTDERTYPWGDDLSCDYANFEWCFSSTMPVGSFPAGASPYGVLDMAGNAAEWVWDWYSIDYYSISPYENPTGPEDGKYRVIRGGAFSMASIYIKVFDRESNSPKSNNPHIGFRCVFSP